MTRNILTLVAVAGLLAISGAAVAMADAVYHTERLLFTATNAEGHPSDASGHVVNIHPNGPVNGAIENYKINGAKPNTDYAVILSVFESCGGDFLFLIETATLSTNKHGNGHARFVFPAEDLVPLSGLTLGAQWTLEAEGVVAYETECTTVVLD